MIKLPFSTLRDEANAIDVLINRVHLGKRIVYSADFCSDAYKAATDLRLMEIQKRA